MAATDNNIHEHIARLRLKMVQQKLARAKGKAVRSPSPQEDGPTDKDHHFRLQQAVLRRQELLDRIRQENDRLRRPKSDGGKKRKPPSPPPSRRSLPDYSTKHIIEHQVKPISPVAPRLRPIENPPQPPPPPQPYVPPLPPQFPSQVIQQGPFPADTSTKTNKGDFMEMLMMQNAQLHQLMMQQMMMSSLSGSNSSTKQSVPQFTVPLNLYPPEYPQPPPQPQILTVKNDRPASVHHHHYSLRQEAPPPPQPQPVIHHVTQLPPIQTRVLPPPPRTPSSVTPPPKPKKMREPKATPTPPSKPKLVRKIPFPGSRLLRKLRHIFYAAWFIAFLRAEMRKNKGNKPNEKFIFGIQLKEAVAALHRIYLNPDGNIYLILSDMVGEGAPDLYVEDKGRFGTSPEDKQNIQELTYIVENLTYHITEIMPATGVLGTHKKAAIFELIKEGKEFPAGYFWQMERDQLEFDENDKITNVTDARAFFLLIGIFLSRSLVTTLLMKPLDYGLSTTVLSEVGERNLKLLATIIVYLIRVVAVPRKQTPLPIPYEISKFLYTDEEMKFILSKLKKSLDYAEGLLRDWGEEYVKRLRAAGPTKKEG
ncbi:relA-associated inhibitor [Lingula anatina]|uniref:RelA-associated inhibitor n=1 Tax=Lingula anatina TaxID=7574 RepID=A0A1S3HDP7_LINAN|nr:relA-associated inhibitor [Lingula anatina]|eukprot:XP_013384150.1 relA-associated inhibitor [Lingula anatina]